MPLLSLKNISIAFGAATLLEHAELQVDKNERVCLIGRNGAGKSTLLKIIAGELQADEGELWRQPGMRTASLGQSLPTADSASVFETVASGIGELGRLLNEYHTAALRLHEDPKQLALLEGLQHELEAVDGWRFHQKVETVLTRLALPADSRLAELSGGWRRRVALGRALVCEPELLLLDEPTNHLDIETIEWLEEQLLAFSGGLLFITHDRRLLERLATRIVELDRGRLTSWPGDFASYQKKKAELLAAEARHAAEFDRFLAQEEVWIRKGIEARRTRNEGRVKRLEALREQRRQRRELAGRAQFDIASAEASGKLIVEADKIAYRWPAKILFEDFSIRIMRGDRIGLIGPNGCGKTSLLRVLLGELKPHTGQIRLGTKLQIAYFDQLRERLVPELSVLDNLAEGREFLEINGQRRHVIGYLGDFLFPPERVRSPVKSLSGGEINRLLLARLFSQAANLLVLDEPTNDLDMETLELLEERLLEFDGTLLLVSHDRAFLDHVVTSVLAFEDDASIREYVGGYSDWLRQRKPAAANVNSKPAGKPTPKFKPRSSERPRTKLSYKDQRELEQLPQRIEQLEESQRELQQRTADPEFYQCPPDEVKQVLAQLETLSTELETAYNRWEQLEQLSNKA